jgi:chromosome segregation ATPase
VASDYEILAREVNEVRRDLAEGFGAANAQHEEYDRRLDSIERRLHELAKLEGRFEERARAGDDTKQHSTALARLDERVAGTQKALDELVATLARERKAHDEQVAELRKKIAALESRPKREKRVQQTAIAGGAAGGVAGIIALITWLVQTLAPLFTK